MQFCRSIYSANAPDTLGEQQGGGEHRDENPGFGYEFSLPYVQRIVAEEEES